MAAVRYLDFVERIGAMSISDPMAAGGTGRVSDGGAVNRCQRAADLARYRSVLTGVAVPDKGATGTRRPITCRAAVDMVCLEQATVTDVLRRHGWTRTGGKNAKAHFGVILAALDAMARI